MKKIFGNDSIYNETEISILQNVMLYDEVNDYLIYGKQGLIGVKKVGMLGEVKMNRKNIVLQYIYQVKNQRILQQEIWLVKL